MTTINHECYVSLEVAKLLKEAGFDWGTLTYYPIDDKVLNERALVGSNVVFNHNRDDSAYSAPSLSVAQRWLREVKGVYLDIDTHFNSAGVWFSYVINVLDSDAKFGTYSNCLGAGHSFNEYKEAQEAGIKKVLEIILEKGE